MGFVKLGGETRAQQLACLEARGEILTPAKNIATVGDVPVGACFKRGWYWHRVWSTGAHVICSPGANSPSACKRMRKGGCFFDKAVWLSPAEPCEYTPKGGC